MVQCRICGNIFDENSVEPCECLCGCGGSNVLCPNCGAEVKLDQPKKSKSSDNKTLVSKIISLFG